MGLGQHVGLFTDWKAEDGILKGRSSLRTPPREDKSDLSVTRMLGHSDSNTKTDPGRSLKIRACPVTRLHFIKAFSPPSCCSRNVFVDGAVGGNVSSSSHDHMSY